MKHKFQETDCFGEGCGVKESSGSSGDKGEMPGMFLRQNDEIK